MYKPDKTLCLILFIFIKSILNLKNIVSPLRIISKETLDLELFGADDLVDDLFPRPLLEVSDLNLPLVDLDLFFLVIDDPEPKQ